MSDHSVHREKEKNPPHFLNLISNQRIILKQTLESLDFSELLDKTHLEKAGLTNLCSEEAIFMILAVVLNRLHCRFIPLILVFQCNCTHPARRVFLVRHIVHVSEQLSSGTDPACTVTVKKNNIFKVNNHVFLLKSYPPQPPPTEHT